VPIEPNSNVPTTAPAIENEIPAYRAISGAAVVALILGILSILSMLASLYFLPLAVAAVVVGALADRKIRRYPDILTGRGLAQAGVGLGLIFGLSALTFATVQSLVRVTQAKSFARAYEKVIKDGSFADAVWLAQIPDARGSAGPDAFVEQSNKNSHSRTMFEERFHPLRELKKALAEKADFHFVRIESHGEQELTQFAGALYAVHSHDAKNPADADRYALAVIKWDSTPSKNGPPWWVFELIYPYKDNSFVAPAREKKPGDDGHGHSH
jgi:hypothetical protein